MYKEVFATLSEVEKEAHRAKRREQQRRWLENNRGKAAVYGKQTRARKKVAEITPPEDIARAQEIALQKQIEEEAELIKRVIAQNKAAAKEKAELKKTGVKVAPLKPEPRSASGKASKARRLAEEERKEKERLRHKEWRDAKEDNNAEAHLESRRAPIKLMPRDFQMALLKFRLCLGGKAATIKEDFPDDVVAELESDKYWRVKVNYSKKTRSTKNLFSDDPVLLAAERKKAMNLLLHR